MLEHIQINGFQQKLGCTQVHGPDDGLGIAISGHENDASDAIIRPGGTVHVVQHVEAVKPRHHQVAEDDGNFSICEVLVQRFLAIARHHHAQAQLGDELGEFFTNIGFIIDYQRFHKSSPSISSCPLLAICDLLCNRGKDTVIRAPWGKFSAQISPCMSRMMP